jgi:hypothetical protein
MPGVFEYWRKRSGFKNGRAYCPGVLERKGWQVGAFPELTALKFQNKKGERKFRSLFCRPAYRRRLRKPVIAVLPDRAISLFVHPIRRFQNDIACFFGSRRRDSLHLIKRILS